MNFVILDSALPVRFGHPRQRLSYALRHALTQFGTVHGIVVDCWDTEWRDRGLSLKGDLFYGHALAADHVRQTPMLNRSTLPAKFLIDGYEIPSSSLRTGWLSQKRRARLLARVQAIECDLVIINDPVLWDLIADLRSIGLRVVCLDNGMADWADLEGTRLSGAETGAWFDLLRIFLETGIGGRDILRTPLSTARADRAGIALDVEQEQSDVLFEKSGKLVVPATGFDVLDDKILQIVEAFRKDQTLRGQAPAEIVLVGFSAHRTTRFKDIECQPQWTRLHTMIGIAGCVFMPFLTPWLRPFVDSCLKVGTPILSIRSDTDRYGLTGLRGIYAVLSNELIPALGQILDADFHTVAQTQAIARDAQPVLQSPKARPLQSYLQDWLGTDVKPVKGATVPAPHRTPLNSPARVFYTPLTRMLMINLKIRSWSDVEEVRLYDGADRELTRLAPNINQKKNAVFEVEGGLVIPLDALAGAVTIRCYRDVEEVYSVRIPQEQFEIIQCGISTLKAAGDGLLDGALWVGGDLRSHLDRLALSVNGTVTTATVTQDHVLEGLDAAAITFRVPAPKTHIGRVSVEIGLARNGRLTGTLPQKLCEGSLPHLARPPTLTPQLAALKDIHRGKRAWILGNGPSVRLDDLARIPQEDVTFAFNRFYLSYDDQPLREDYVVSADTLMIKDFGQEMIDLAAGLPLFCIGHDTVSELNGPYVMLSPGATTVPLFSYDASQFVSVGGSSVFVALQMAWFMGIRDIVLYGLDYSFSAKLHRDPRYPFPVSYDEGNHFIASYRSAKPWCPPTWRDISAGFANARVAFELTGGRIVNATRGGLLETFERVDFDHITPQKPRQK